MTENKKNDIITDNTIQPLAFFCAVQHKHRVYLVETLKEYNIGTYIIGYEVAKGAHEETDGEHIHFYVEMSTKDYHKYSKRVFKDKFKLQGQARGGKPRQYGKVKKIESLEKMKMYTVKEGNVDTNLSDKELKDLIEKSHEKDESLTLRDMCLNRMKKLDLPDWGEEGLDKYLLDDFKCCCNYQKLERCIMETCLQEGVMPFSATMNKNIIKRYIFESEVLPNQVKVEIFYKLEETKNPWIYYAS